MTLPVASLDASRSHLKGRWKDISTDQVPGAWRCSERLPVLGAGRKAPSADAPEGKAVPVQAVGVAQSAAEAAAAPGPLLGHAGWLGPSIESSLGHVAALGPRQLPAPATLLQVESLATPDLSATSSCLGASI